MVIRNPLLAYSVLMGCGETGGILEAKLERHHRASNTGPQNQVDIHSNRICVPECWIGHFKNYLYANDSWIYRFFPDLYIHLLAWHYHFSVTQNWCGSKTGPVCSSNLILLQSSPSEIRHLHFSGCSDQNLWSFLTLLFLIPHIQHISKSRWLSIQNR